MSATAKTASPISDGARSAAEGQRADRTERWTNPPEDRPTEWTCTACSAVITSPEHEQNGEHVGCGGRIELRDMPTARLVAGTHAVSCPKASDHTQPCACELAGNYPATPAPAPTPAPSSLDLGEPIQLGEPLEAPEPPEPINASSALELVLGPDPDPAATAALLVTAPARRKMPPDRTSRTRTFRLAHQGEITEFEFIAGFYDDGTLGEIFIHADRQGAMLSGFLDATGIMISMLIQYGVPVAKIIGKLKGMRFPPDGRVMLGGKGESVFAHSPLDLLARWLATLAPALEASNTSRERAE